MLTRRRFSALASASALTPMRAASLDAGASSKAIVEVLDEHVGIVRPDFIGLSYESTQLYDPNHFSPDNLPLVDAFRRLSRHGVLRLGGNLSDCSVWKSDAGDFMTPKLRAAVEHGRTYWEWRLCSPSVDARRNGAITPSAIAKLRAFLDATGWRVIYGLNFGSGNAARAGDEGRHAVDILGDKLIALQVGNEVDFYAGNPFFRSTSYDFAEYYAGYTEFAGAVRKSRPRAPFAGPDTAANMEWVDRFGRLTSDAVLLTSHYYAMGPAKDPAMNAARLLNSNSQLERRLDIGQRDAARANIPFRITEANSCYGGGKPGVSNAYASTLWSADFLLQAATLGCAGIDLHGGGDGLYTPIESRGTGEVSVRPVYYGMQFAQLFAGAQLQLCRTTPTSKLRAYAGRRNADFFLALINKSATAISLEISWPEATGRPLSRAVRLAGTSLDAKTNISWTEVPAELPQFAELPAYGAAFLQWT